VKIAPAVIFIAAGFSGCHKKLVATLPVPPQQTAVEISPSKHHVWIPGKYVYKKGKHRWRNGRYRDQSASKPIFVAGHWKQTGKGFVWVRGKWKKF
jgi:hypothetical protein